ncbi:MAG: DUF2933 domain-containing protein [Deltaproteobacteria bacterium]|nr:DUF2933 domain-containing protein [Deltaproteobacteria bacterium]MBW2308487.1 DUF2933 domain-containing protein [Deltaproteobacteria bacterium]
MNKPGAQKKPRPTPGVIIALGFLTLMAALGILLGMGLIGSWSLYLFFLLCPLTHFLLMRKMGNGSHHGSHR